MSECTGNPEACGFCTGAPAAHDHCAKDEVRGCAADPKHCTACEGAGCLATECTGIASTCKACQAGHFKSCRRKVVNATEGIERAA
ncbi:hypothetical protein CspeluHIS016_0401430 [Cutaneotrichosporon spelunceum]|uniref:Uncharacterized protein n=1 Tax=Cutaneotrichosporon spelunceum TaxID=1672016 RepID=A0AAD3YCX2_9TREE|nr:hypothetical protein CspeluHIS016_0401430 [Cutaneotrichosporon spelunceum]